MGFLLAFAMLFAPQAPMRVGIIVTVVALIAAIKFTAGIRRAQRHDRYA
jgi:hypothetical protein